MDRFEYINWWGYSPAFDLLENIPSDIDEVNVLLLGTGDCRHILETASNLYNNKKNVNLYVVENSLEQYAKHMLLLSLILEDSKGIQEKSEMFLEIHGNSLIRKHTAEFIEQASEELLKMVTDYSYLSKKLPVFDLTNLKYKERDFLETIFKYWRKEEKGDMFNMAKCWDFRLRSYLGTRYDAIPNVFDWHFHMKLADKNAEIIGSRNYILWRKTGVAYELRDGDYNVGNKTLTSAVAFKNEGDRIATRGYWGDIILGPFISFGIECEEKNFFKKCNRILTKTSEDVSLYNMNRIIHQIVHKQKYKSPSTDVHADNDDGDDDKHDNDIETGIVNMNEMDLNKDDEACKQNNGKEYIDNKNMKIIFLPHLIIPKLHHNTKFNQFFHVIYFGNSQLQKLTQDLVETFQDQASVYFETVKFMLDLKKEEIERVEEKMKEIATDAGCKEPLTMSDGACIRYTFTRPETKMLRSE